MNKIKNSNDLLGFLIKNANERDDVDNSTLCKKTNMDSVSLMHLLNELKEKRYIIYSYDTTTVTQLGKNNYISTFKKISLFLLKMIIITIKEIIVFSLGVISGILINYISSIFIL